ncbi:hypothetical protein [Parasphingorhabdus sp.]|uniref:hypothetical protein n=1 Tax=Parasphingorhabdus sp. TaxID=2709688 RepID=UPI0032652531
MRSLFIVPLVAVSLSLAAPASAQDAAPESEWTEKLADPEFQDQMAGMMTGLVKMVMEIPVGQFAAAAEKALPEELADKVDSDGKLSRIDPDMTIGDLARKDDPDFDQNIEGKVRKGTVMASLLASELGTLLPQLEAMAKRLKHRMGELE